MDKRTAIPSFKFTSPISALISLILSAIKLVCKHNCKQERIVFSSGNAVGCAIFWCETQNPIHFRNENIEINKTKSFVLPIVFLLLGTIFFRSKMRKNWKRQHCYDCIRNDCYEFLTSKNNTSVASVTAFTSCKVPSMTTFSLWILYAKFIFHIIIQWMEICPH